LLKITYINGIKNVNKLIIKNGNLFKSLFPNILENKIVKKIIIEITIKPLATIP